MREKVKNKGRSKKTLVYIKIIYIRSKTYIQFIRYFSRADHGIFPVSNYKQVKGIRALIMHRFLIFININIPRLVAL